MRQDRGSLLFGLCRIRGEKSQYLTVTLTNAGVASQQFNGSKNGLDSYEFELTYQKMRSRCSITKPAPVDRSAAAAQAGRAVEGSAT